MSPLTVIVLLPGIFGQEQLLTRLQRKRGGGAGEKESRTGTEFAKNFCHLSKSNCPCLVGVG